jgi:GNAT superfamily N-acetyltransferase
MTIIQINKDNIDQATMTLFLAFRHDPLMLWMFDGEDNYQRKAQAAIKAWVRWCMLYGVALATPQCEAVALRKKPNKHYFNFWSVFRSGMWKFPSMLGQTIFKRMMLVDNLLQKEQLANMSSEQFWYCWMIGTHPDQLQKGYATRLMNHTFDLAKQTKLPCYLETASEKSMMIHQKKGYEHMSTIQIPDSSIKIYCMSR